MHLCVCVCVRVRQQLFLSALISTQLRLSATSTQSCVDEYTIVCVCALVVVSIGNMLKSYNLE